MAVVLVMIVKLLSMLQKSLKPILQRVDSIRFEIRSNDALVVV